MPKRYHGSKGIHGLLLCVMKSIIILLMYQQQRYSYITLKQDSRKNGALGVNMPGMDKYLFHKEVIGLLFH